MIEKPDIERYLWNINTKEELISMNQIIRQRIKELEAHQTWNYQEGDKVEWNGKRGHLTGIVEQINKTTVTVDAGVNGKWRIPPSMLKKVEEE
jgi:uncharacterized protein YkvS